MPSIMIDKPTALEDLRDFLQDRYDTVDGAGACDRPSANDWMQAGTLLEAVERHISTALRMRNEATDVRVLVLERELAEGPVGAGAEQSPAGVTDHPFQNSGEQGFAWRCEVCGKPLGLHDSTPAAGTLPKYECNCPNPEGCRARGECFCTSTSFDNVTVTGKEK